MYGKLWKSHFEIVIPMDFPFGGSLTLSFSIGCWSKGWLISLTVVRFMVVSGSNFPWVSLDPGDNSPDGS